MVFDGIETRRVGHIVPRMSKSGDLDSDGSPLGAGTVCFCYASRCEVVEKNGKKLLDASRTACIPLSYGGTYYGYGRPRLHLGAMRYTRKGKTISVNRWWSRPVYFCRDWKVYRGSVVQFEQPADWSGDPRLAPLRQLGAMRG